MENYLPKELHPFTDFSDIDLSNCENYYGFDLLQSINVYYYLKKTKDERFDINYLHCVFFGIESLLYMEEFVIPFCIYKDFGLSDHDFVELMKKQTFFFNLKEGHNVIAELFKNNTCKEDFLAALINNRGYICDDLLESLLTQISDYNKLLSNIKIPNAEVLDKIFKIDNNFKIDNSNFNKYKIVISNNNSIYSLIMNVENLLSGANAGLLVDEILNKYKELAKNNLSEDDWVFEQILEKQTNEIFFIKLLYMVYDKGNQFYNLKEIIEKFLPKFISQKVCAAIVKTKQIELAKKALSLIKEQNLSKTIDKQTIYELHFIACKDIADNDSIQDIIVKYQTPNEVLINVKKIYNAKAQQNEGYYIKTLDEKKQELNNGVAQGYRIPPLQKFEIYLFEQKDYFFIDKVLPTLEEFNCYSNFGLWFFETYEELKHKTIIDIYNSTLKKNFSLIDLDFLTDLRYHSSDLIELDIVEQIIKDTQDFQTCIKYLKKAIAVVKLIHNSDAELDKDIVVKAILNPKFDITNKTLQELLSCFNWVKRYNNDIEQVIIKINQIQNIGQFINVEQFKKNANLIKQLLHKFYNNEAIQVNEINYPAIKQLYTDFCSLNNIDAIIKYTKSAKPKNEKLFDLELSLPNGIEFSVLKFLDPYALRIGEDTNCCQRIGGAGEDAAIDSYINPLAGVLVCKYKELLLAQSYFHYIPKDNGFILDNVEWNKTNCMKLNIDNNILSQIYALYAKQIKNNLNISYFRCGKSYNKLNENIFESSELEVDTRHFEHGEKYSDFDKDDNLDLLKPTDENIKLPQIKAPTTETQTSTASTIIPLLKKLAINQYCKHAFASKNITKQSYAFSLYLH